MDLKNFVPSNDDVTVELKIKEKNLTNADGSNMTITVMSPHSKKYKEVLHQLSRERLKAIKEDDGDENAGGDFEAFAMNVLVETTTGWNITWDGKKPKFNKQLAREIYESAFWIKMLISEAQAKLSDFTIP